MNCPKIISDENISDKLEEENTQSQKNPSTMTSSVQISTATCPSSSSSVQPTSTTDFAHYTDSTYMIESIVSTYTTPINPYKYTRKNSTSRNSPESIKKFAQDKRRWEEIRKPKRTTNNFNGISFVVMSYNILAQTLLEEHSYLYRDCSRSDLIWENRWKRISAEILQQNPDILCLQEVETSYLDEIGSFLNNHGYKGIFKQKTGLKVDGCAIFFKSDLFAASDYLSVEYMQPGILLLNRDNVGMMVKFTSKSDDNLQFVVCTTHLLYNPRRTDVRLAQVQLLLAEIDRFSYFNNANNDKAGHLPVIMTGDFNSLPNTPVTMLIDSGNVNIDRAFPNLYDVAITNACQHLEIYLERLKDSMPNAKAMSMLYHSEVQKDNKKSLIKKKYSFDEYRHLFDNNFIRHHLNFTSVYGQVKKDGQSEATTFQDGWVTVDYIYYSSSQFGRLDVLNRYRLPTGSECNDMGFIPNSFYGSDHLALAAKFTLSQCNSDTSEESPTDS